MILFLIQPKYTLIIIPFLILYMLDHPKHYVIRLDPFVNQIILHNSVDNIRLFYNVHLHTFLMNSRWFMSKFTDNMISGLLSRPCPNFFLTHPSHLMVNRSI